MHRLADGNFDLVLFSGDLTNRGTSTEFQRLDEMLESLWTQFRRLGSDPVLLAVPGNHDLVRPKDHLAPVRELLRWKDDLIDAVHRWTDGHPYMTMRACAALLRRGSVTPGEEATLVDEIIREEFLTHPMEDPNLFYAAGRFEDPKFERPEALLGDKMLLLRRLLDGERIAANFDQRAQTELWLCGMAKGVEDGEGLWLRPRNRVYETVFDVAWLQKRGDRKYLAEALRKWLESGKKKDYLLRGEALGDALQRDPRLLTEEEQEFLVSSAEDEVRFWESNANLVQHQRKIYALNSKSLAHLSKNNKTLDQIFHDTTKLIRTCCYAICIFITFDVCTDAFMNKAGSQTIVQAVLATLFLAMGIVLNRKHKKVAPLAARIHDELDTLSKTMPEDGELARGMEALVTELQAKMAARREQLQKFAPHASTSTPPPPP